MRKKISAAFAGTVAEHAYVTTYCCSERSRRAYCPSKSWLTRTNATGRNDLQTAKTIIPRKKSCSRYSMYATIDDFGCTETQADGSNSERIPKRLFFFLRCRPQSKTTTTTLRDTALALSASALGVPAPAALLVLKTLTEATAPCMLASFAPSRGHGPLGCPGRQRPLCLAGLSCCCSLPQA